MSEQPVLQTHDLSIGYRTPRQPDIVVAEHLTLSLRAGELVALLGPNGAGKSTLMRTIAGMQQPLAGGVTLSGDGISNLSPRELASRLSVVLTDRPNLGLLNGYALVALGRHPHTDWTGRLTRHDEAVIRWAVDAVDAHDLAERPVMELSDGQRQKFMIARALAQESELILLDEPTAYLDLPRRAEIMGLLRNLAADTGRAILLSTHDLDLALRSADALWLMSDGWIRVGTPEDLVLNGSFEDAFRSAGVTFDRETGAFDVRRKRQFAPVVALGGGGVPVIWTRRALRRAGFNIVDADHDAELRVVVSGDADHPTWQVHQHDQVMTADSIGHLLATLHMVTERLTESGQ